MLCFSRATAQSVDNYLVQANIIYRFTKYIDWPESKKNVDFIIGVVGSTPLYDVLKSFTINKGAGNQHIVIKKFLSSASSFDCHILFVCSEESGNIKKIAGHTMHTPILLVTESDIISPKNTCINFHIVDERLKLEINKTNIEEGKMNIASELLQLGVLIK